ncbi:putative ferric-chelate reductase 1 [Synchiropus splendidus]|uniref:putative ferric-chelate reductase 1 n=1 Tax=Synchiropus splendidus TaxID=270530 RepID=UPI00237EDB22|nr:putative ferric-chelate reductase 1 [Synchiropus splendidus]
MDLLLLLLAAAAPGVLGYSSGQVTDSCQDLLPRHRGQSPSTDSSPFSVTTDQSSFSPGEELTVWLRAPGSEPFTGFLLQAREVGGQTPVGSFFLSTQGARLLHCSLQPNSSVSHTSSSPKTFIQVSWTASEVTEPVQFHATFVKDYRTFWVDVTSPVVALNSSQESTNTTASPAATSSPQPAPSPDSISSEDCGTSKVCFSHPSRCNPDASRECFFMSAKVVTDAEVHYEVTGPSEGYVSFGFSDDQMMGNDDIYICGSSPDGQLWLRHAFSTGRRPPQTLPLGDVSGVRVSLKDGVISCSFTSRNPISIQRSAGLEASYHLMLASGPTDSSGQIRIHTQTSVSTEKVDISKPGVVGRAGWPHIIKAHGALMLIAWMTTGSLGMMVARFLKGSAAGRKLWGRDAWFSVHVAVMSLTVILTAIGFILSFAHVRVWSGGAHPVLGCLVLILSLIQPTLALVRCGPDHQLRFLFTWSHTLTAVAVKALAVSAIFTGLKLMDSSPGRWLMKVMGGFVGWEALFFLMLDLDFKCRLNGKGTKGSGMISSEVVMTGIYLLGNLTFLIALLTSILNCDPTVRGGAFSD